MCKGPVLNLHGFCMANEWKVIILMIVLSACQQEKPNLTPLAQVNESFLYLEDVKQILPENLSEADSTLWVDDFVKRWVRTELVILNAEQNLTPEQKNVDKELKEYRNSLITYRYKKELMAQKMDTVVKAEDIEQYFREHQQEYILKNNIVKAVFLKTPIEVANPEIIKNLCLDNDPLKLAQLDEYSIQYAKAYDRFDDKWINSTTILAQIPDEITDEERFLRRNKFIESSDTDYYYFICIRDFRLQGQIAPVEYIESDIRNIILNQRKVKFLRNIENDIYKEGLASNKFKIYNIQK